MPSETFFLSAKTPEELMFTASTLAKSLYLPQTDILLTGELGAGKTTFVKGLASGLGLSESTVVSPTFALEQRYLLPDGERQLIHIDLYRLSQKDTTPLLAATDDIPGIRCIEWPERAETEAWSAIRLHVSEENGGRLLSVTCDDLPLPETSDVDAWRREMHLPEHIIRHCETVANLCDEMADALRRRGVFVRMELLRAAARTHDLLRFVDFRESAAPDFPPPSVETLAAWSAQRVAYPKYTHEEAAGAFLRSHGFDAVATVVETHGVRAFEKLQTVEQKILYYADKRAMGEHVVSLDERFADFAARYGSGMLTEEQMQWLSQAKTIERELL